MALLKCMLIALVALALTEATSVPTKPITPFQPYSTYPGYLPATGYYPASLSTYSNTPTDYFQRYGSYNTYPTNYQRYYSTRYSSAPAAYDNTPVSPYLTYPYNYYPTNTAGFYPSQYTVPNYYPSQYAVPSNYPSAVETVAPVSTGQLPGFGYTFTTYGQPVTTNVEGTKLKVDPIYKP